MPRKRTSMPSVREILRLSLHLGMSANAIHEALHVSRGTVQDCLRRARQANLEWPLPADIGDEQLEKLLYGPASTPEPPTYVVPDFEQINKELCRKGVTLRLLWQEYAGNNPGNHCSYWHYTRLYRKWCGKHDLVMRQAHTAGEKLFVDFAGPGVAVVDRETGETTMAQIFVATMGASNYTFAVACPAQDLRSWLTAHIQCFRFLRGVPKFLVPDNTKTAVIEPARHDPLLNKSYRRLAEHYGCAIIPARPYRPKDKAKVEKGVQFVEQRILARLRNVTFFSLDDLNRSIGELLTELNNEPFQKLPGCRRERFEQIDKPALLPLPEEPFEFEQWRLSVRVPKDYHVEVGGHYYSVPYRFVGERVDVRFTDSTIEVLLAGARIASHVRSWAEGEKTSAIEHMPRSHAAYHGISAEQFIEWAYQIGPSTTTVVKAVLASKPYPQLSFDQCFGIVRTLRTKYGTKALETASCHILRIGCPSYRVLKSVLEHGVDKLPEQLPLNLAGIDHPNIRGPEHFT
jgi:transposase